MKIKVVSLDTLRKRSAMLDMLLRRQDDMLDEKDNSITISDIHKLQVHEQMYGFFTPKCIEQRHKYFIEDLSNPDINYEMIISKYDMRLLLVLLDYYCVDAWYCDIVNFVAKNELVYWRVFNHLLVMSFIDNRIVDSFAREVDNRKHYRPMPPFQPFEKRRQIARSFAEIIAVIGTYADRK